MYTHNVHSTHSELAVVGAEQWHQIRGTIILLLMKTTSLGFDVDAGVITPPPALLFFGYTLSPVSLIFGPFVTLSDYRQSKHTPFVSVLFSFLRFSILNVILHFYSW